METKNKFSALHRLLHWVMAFSMPVLLVTGFLRMYWMGKKAVFAAVNSQDLEVTKEQSNAMYKVLREPMWEWHVIFAHVMIIAFIIRVIYMIAKGIRFPNPFKGSTSIKEKMQGLTYIYFYLYVFMAAFTGICLRQDFFPDLHKPLEATHKLGVYLFPIFIVLHFVGVFLAEKGKDKGITSKMIGGE
ncbi:MAG: cytochrome b/b6 domain-containing protein [Brumimicrobium sp.]|nr:cytochrome b/b6 domain-containing protein [Brumimicrobium sp.]